MTTLQGFVVATALAGAASAAERADAAARLFETYCLGAAPDPAALNDRAAAASYPVILDQTIPMGRIQSISHKHWLVPERTGPLMLTSEDVVDGSSHMIGCGVAVTEIAEPDIERALTADARLGEPTARVEGSESGQSTVTWRVKPDTAGLDGGSEVLLVHKIPGKNLIIVTLTSKVTIEP